MSLIKMQIVKADENCSTFTRLWQCMRTGDTQEAERLLGVLQEGNNTALRELQSEIADGINVVSEVHNLTELLRDEREDFQAAIKALSDGKALSPRKILDGERQKQMS
jgi:hypothetical protein